MNSRHIEFKTISPSEITQELERLLGEGEADEVVYSNSSSRNVYVLTNVADDPTEIEKLLTVMTENLPGRYFILNESAQEEELICSISARCIRLSDSEHLCSEVLKFQFGPTSIPALESILRAHRIAGVNTDVIVYSEKPSSLIFRAADARASEVIFDSRRLVASEKGLQDVSESNARLIDLGWVRLGSWRRLIAQLFDVEEYRSLLPALSEIEICYERTEIPSQASDAYLIGGWIISALGLTVDSVSAFGFECLKEDGESSLRISLCQGDYGQLKGELKRVKLVLGAQGEEQTPVFVCDRDEGFIVGSIEYPKQCSISVAYKEMDFLMGVQEHYLVGETFERYPSSLKASLELRALRSGFCGSPS
jgi:hypothetical protein